MASSTYRPTEIRVERFGTWFYSAFIILRDIGEPELGEEPPLFRGLALEEGPYNGLTHRRAWKHAHRAVKREYGRLF